MPRALCPAARVAAATHGMRCKALLVLAVCLSVTALPYGMGSLAALSQIIPASPHLPPAQPGSRFYQSRVSDSLVTVSEDPRASPGMQQPGTALVGSAGTFLGVEGDLFHSVDAERWNRGTLTGDAAVPSTPQTLLALQTGEAQGSSDATVAAMLSKALGRGMETPAKLSPELTSSPGAAFTTSWSHPGSHWRHGTALGHLLSKGAGLHRATQLPMVASACKHELNSPVEPVRTRPKSSLLLSSKAVPSISPEHVSQLLSKMQSQVRSWSALWALRMPHQQRAMVESSPAALSRQPWVLTPSRASPGVEEQPAVDAELLGTVLEQVAAHEVAAGKARVPSSVPPGAGSTDIPAGTRTSSHATMDWSPPGQRPAVTASRGRHSSHTTNLPDLAVGTDRTAAAGPAPFPREMPTPSCAAEEFRGPAVTLEKQGDLSSCSTKLAVSTSTDGLPSSTLRSGIRAASNPTAVVSLAALDTVSEPRVLKTSYEDGTVAPSSLKTIDVTDASSLRPATEIPSLHPKLFPTVSLVTSGTPDQDQVTRVATEVAERSALPREATKAEGATSGKPTMTSGDVAVAPSGPPKATHAIQSSAFPPSSKRLPSVYQPEPAVQTSTAGFSPLSYEPSSTRAMHSPKSLLTSWTVAAPTGFMPDTQPMPTVLAAASENPFTSGNDLLVTVQPSSAEEGGFVTTASPAEPMPTSKLSSPGVKPTVPQAPGMLFPTQPLPVRVLPLQFRLTGITYNEALGRKSSESYKKLEEEVVLMLNKMLSTYENFLQANILEFMNGSVIVQAEAVFRSNGPAPTNSHLIRTILTEASRERDTLSWQLEPRSIQSGGFSLENLDPEKLSISLTALRLGSVASGGMSRTDPLDSLVSEVIQSLSALYDVKNFTIAQLRNLRGDLEISGEIYLDTDAHADIEEVLQALKALATFSVDMTSLSVEGAKLNVKTYPISFLIINKRFSEDLLDPFSAEYQELARDLGDVVERALKYHRTFLQALIKGFLPGSLICHGDLIFQHPAPSSQEVLEALAVSVGPDKALAGSGFQVDPYSLAVGEDTLEPPLADPGFPEYGVVIIVMCGLGIITVPIILLVCLRTQRLGWQDVAALWDRRDPEAGTQTMEMENQGFWAASEEASGLRKA